MRTALTRGCGVLLLGFIAAMATACGGSDDTGSGGPGAGGGGSGATGSGTTTGAGGSPSDVAVLDQALDGNCPEGSSPPGMGVTPGDDLHKVTLGDYPDAKCNDGSPAIMYVRRAAVPAAETSWVIFLQFGGACQSWEICRDRWCSTNTTYDAAKMSSEFAPEVMRGNGLLSRSAENAFGAANQVFVYYCSSDAWVGQKDDVVLDDPAGAGPSYRLHFRGFSILEAVDDALSKGITSDDGVETMPKLSDATRVMFAGGSAGSAGQTHALDWWVAQHPGIEAVGFFDASTDPMLEDLPNQTVASTIEGFLPTRYSDIFQGMYGAHLDESCVAAHPGDDAYLCTIGTHVRLNHITTPFFVRHDLRDTVGFNAYESLGMTLDEYGEAMEATMDRYVTLLDDAEEKADMTRAPGVYTSNCKQHIVALNDGWFGTKTNPATVELPNGNPISVHDALGGWINGNDIRAMDTQPSTKSFCLPPTDDQ
jgi:hypothetical protein